MNPDPDKAYDERRENARCPKCGQSFAVHKDDGSCVADLDTPADLDLSQETANFLIVETEGTSTLAVVERADDWQSAIGYLLQCERPTVDLLRRTPDGRYRFSSYVMPEASDDNVTQLNRTRAGMTLCNAAIYVLRSDGDGATVEGANDKLQRAYDALGAAALKARLWELRKARQLLEAAESVLSAAVVLDGPRQQLAGEIREFLKSFGR